MRRTVALLLMSVAGLQAQVYTRGVGVYPGDPRQDWSPTTREDSKTYRNLALHRAAYHSRGYDYNLTAQLVTDGITATQLPRWVAVTTSEKGVLPKNEREWILDDNWTTGVELRGRSVWVQIEVAGGDAPPEIDRIQVDASARSAGGDNQEWTCTVTGSDDGAAWKPLGVDAHVARPTGEIHPDITFKAPSRSRFYRLQFDNDRPLMWKVGEVKFLLKGEHVHIGGPYSFTSAWKSAGTGEEWVYVDLGAKCKVDRVNLRWIRPAAEGSIQVSDDAQAWKTIHALDSDAIQLPKTVEARYVRVLMTKPATPEGYVLSELEVFGRGGPVVVPKTAATGAQLAGGAWKLQRESQIQADGAALSQPGFEDRDWLVASVPGTVLTSYLNAGAIPDPNYGDNQLQISDSFFCANFWYRNEFAYPVAAGKHVWLNFDGINWKADVWLNGANLGRIEGGFTRARFDVTDKLRASGNNGLAVRIVSNATTGSVKEKTFEHPDTNGGALGADNPTYHASIGWDWIPTIRGRNTGIWNDVRLTTTGGVTVGDPLVSSVLPLPDISRADVTIEVTLQNHDAAAVQGTLRGRFGEVAFEEPVSLAAASSRTVRHTIALSNPKLWWPADYGEANLYHVELKFGDSDAQQFQAGVRQFTYSEEGGALRIWINGRRFVARGGNWGFGESMLRYRGREYEAAIRYHRDMHFNMIRNWVGQIGDDEFYEACDRNGIVVMQDFWLANPWDGPDPDDNAMFMANVNDTVQRIRHHPSIGLYCGRNEGYPLKPLDDAIRASLKAMHPDIKYIGSSADDVVTGHGPYRAQALKQYFSQRATPKFHSEMGMPNIVSMDSLRAMMPAQDMWPLGRVWGLHDFCLQGAQGGASFIERIDKSYGGAKDIEKWIWLAQFVNYEGHRAMFEAQSKNRMGLLIWMSHPAWPSMVWQTYDYYLEPTAGYFGAKKGSEPLHIQWNPATESIEVVNYNGGNAPGLTAHAELLNLDGSKQWEKSVSVDSPEDSVQAIFPVEYPAGLSATHFLRLELKRGADIVSNNFYWRGTEEADYRGLRDLPEVVLDAKTRVEHKGDRWILTTEVSNPSKTPALMVRLKAVRQTSGDRILPALYSDNYIALMPGEKVTVVTELQDADTRGERPAIVVEGFNVGTHEVHLSIIPG
jgi:hypothetical protein